MDELCHYGIKGQKWGVRRFQNSDGSYTSEGKRRAQQQEKKDPVKEMKDEDLRKAINRLSLENKYKDLTKKPTPPSKLEPTKKAVDASSELVNRAKKMDQDSRKAAKKERMDLSKKTDKELRDQINRELLERQYNDLFAKEIVAPCYEEAVSLHTDYTSPEYLAFEKKLYEKTLRKLGFGKLLPEERAPQKDMNKRKEKVEER